MHSKFKMVFIYAAILFLSQSLHTHAGTIQNGVVVEDFSTPTHGDFTAKSTGVWNIVDRVAQAAVVANEDASRPLYFGDGSMGELNSSTGYHFNTDMYASGFNFTSVNITGGTITVSGSKPLVIRALGAVNITPTISLNGSTGTIGQTTAATSASGPGGGIAVACASTGGAGGNIASAVATLLTGENGKNSTNVYEGGSSGGAGSIIAGTAAGSGASSALNGPGANFDSGGFVCGVGGGGGGGHFSSAATNASGGSGGAGGGAIQVAALGLVSVGPITANGGNGGDAVADTTRCSGNGAGGGGGAVWLQSAKTVTTGIDPTVAGGTGASAQGGCAGAANSGVTGIMRADATANPGAWPDIYFATSNAAASQTYYVYSKPYDLGTLNAQFTSGASITSTANGGTVQVEFAGSKNETSDYGAYTTNLALLSDKEYRYIIFRVIITTSGVAGATPTVNRISFSFQDIGLNALDLGLSAGCGSIKAFSNGTKGGDTRSTKNSKRNTLLWVLLFGAVWVGFKVRNPIPMLRARHF